MGANDTLEQLEAARRLIGEQDETITALRRDRDLTAAENRDLLAENLRIAAVIEQVLTLLGTKREFEQRAVGATREEALAEQVRFARLRLASASTGDALREARAEVWDEGFYKATDLTAPDFWSDSWSDDHNPYRKETPDDRTD